jgi:hypothetical protein
LREFGNTPAKFANANQQASKKLWCRQDHSRSLWRIKLNSPQPWLPID